jgi:hypothetical protein
LVSEILLRSRKDFAMCLEQKSDYEENRLVRSHGFVAIQLTATELERLVDFFLRYYRDGVVEVDHIDIEANENVPGRMDAYVTIFVQDYRPSVSAEEAKRKLGVG